MQLSPRLILSFINFSSETALTADEHINNKMNITSFCILFSDSIIDVSLANVTKIRQIIMFL